MDPSKKLLVLVDDTPPSERALRYVSQVLRGTTGFTIVLLHMLGPLPARLKESRGAETPRDEDDVEAELGRRHDQFLRKASAETRPLLQKAKAILMSAGVPAQAIQQECAELANSEDFVADILREAHERGCATVVIGRKSFTGLKEFFADHAADDLIQAGQGLAFWVVK
jgi:nucleotide-binding universal stress UspA family protein